VITAAPGLQRGRAPQIAAPSVTLTEAADISKISRAMLDLP